MKAHFSKENLPVFYSGETRPGNIVLHITVTVLKVIGIYCPITSPQCGAQ